MNGLEDQPIRTPCIDYGLWGEASACLWVWVLYVYKILSWWYCTLHCCGFTEAWTEGNLGCLTRDCCNGPAWRWQMTGPNTWLFALLVSYTHDQYCTGGGWLTWPCCWLGLPLWDWRCWDPEMNLECKFNCEKKINLVQHKAEVWHKDKSLV